ncbi:tRNA guanosine(34) transglycosylase Tgt [Kiritimatiella glycovorans]|uniref:Queuine tRNA-ribosyltransferase n=1 Tax=Kiritimatiella glycovorans TaxID=1307763 RepID=A0A0G3EF56_9BACT|nr:tRNA guanosine(34) transglycosylase Tgt [Kiritimatiella glycovorans]AKJ64062.1 Queuine tRNA-ribosyltransferase [Kiritimatiella glycovorans]
MTAEAEQREGRAQAGRFEVRARDAETDARCGVLQTAHGPVHTPVFMPVGTQATVKGMTPRELEELRIEIILGNTYHLSERPGAEVIERLGGLHAFMGWNGAILTDSGGYQVFSLASLREVTEDGVRFRSHVDGAERFLGPDEAMEIQRRLGSDIAMAFDECPPDPSDRDYTCKAVQRTLDWAVRCARAPRAEGQIVFGIVQGGIFSDLREECAGRLADLGFDGYAIGGVSVGEGEELITRGVEDTARHLPPHRPRYLMGVGDPAQIVDAVARGVDMFDCVMPTRLARNGTVMTRRGRYPVKAGRFRTDPAPLEEECGCEVCARFSRAYIRHLFNTNEMLGPRLVTEHNLQVYGRLQEEMRTHIEAGTYASFARSFAAEYRGVRDDL